MRHLIIDSDFIELSRFDKSINQLYLEVDEKGYIKREIGFNKSGDIVHAYLSKKNRYGKYGILDLQTKVVERSWLFELFAGNRNFISDDKGKIFKLTNQALDVIKSGKFKGFESNWETSNSKTGFNSLLNNATNSKGKENAFTYVFRESKDRGYLDKKQNLDPCKIYGASGYAMNKNEAGNYVWGAALAKFGFSTLDAIILANGGTLYLETISRPNREGRGWGIKDIEYRLSRARFDEPDELKAIEAGSIKIIGFQIVY